MGTRLYCIEGKPGVTAPPTASGDRGRRTPSCSQRRTPPTATSSNPSLPARPPPSCSQRRTPPTATSSNPSLPARPPTSTSSNPSLPPLPSWRRTSARARPSRRSCHTHHGWVGLVRLEGHWRRRSVARGGRTPPRGCDGRWGPQRRALLPIGCRRRPTKPPLLPARIQPRCSVAPPLAPRPTGSNGCGTTGARGEWIRLQQFRRVTSVQRRPSSSRRNSGATVRAEACRPVTARRTRAFLSPPAPASSSTR
jgi:hypothetical protein